ncbi:hypothetical protein ACQW02_19925 [Humitalea sp. 24SJ18S-53]|uniref:hypothetical protein n=1 Tax=Humitalea sp. 24SJ18S-53 TaxID=3422307 RepID=UPI003D66A60E
MSTDPALATPPELVTGGPLIAMHDAIVARLREVFPTNKFTHGFVDSRLTPVEWGDLMRLKPFVGLGWGGARPSDANGRRMSATAEWTVFLATGNSAGPTQRYAGDTQGPGLLAMVQVAAGALQGMVVRPPRAREPVGTVEVSGISNLVIDGFQEKNTAIAGIDLRIPFTLEWIAGADEFLRAGAAWVISADETAGPNDDIDIREAP